MKASRRLLMGLILAYLFNVESGATVLTVSNNPNIPAQYSNINNAVSESADGDTIYIHGSPDIYQSVTVSKRLVFIGPGFNPKTESARIAHMWEFLINKSSNNSVFEGLTIHILRGTTFASSDTINLTLRNCAFTYWGGSSVGIGWSYTSMVFDNCVFTTGSINFSGPTGSRVRKGLVIRNNIFGGSGTAPYSINEITDNSIIDHNIFIGTSSTRAFAAAQNCTFSNNIFFGRNIDTTQAVGCIFLNNLTYLNSTVRLPFSGNFGSGNLVNMDPMFEDFPASPTNFSFTQDFRLKAGSPGKNSATDGTDLGVYGGPGLFSMTGEPDGIPVVRAMDIRNSTIPPDGVLEINLKSTIPVKD